MSQIVRYAINEIKKESFIDKTVNDIENDINFLVERAYEVLNEEEYTVRYFKKMFIILGLRKKYISYVKSFTGIDEKNVCIFFIQNHISELLTNINHNAKIFKKEDEDKTNKKHLQQRKKVINYANKIKNMLSLIRYSLKIKDHGGDFTVKERKN